MAYRQELLFMNKHHESIDMANDAMLLNYSLQIWLVQRLFRLLELRSGCIKIDGLDISLLDLKILRQGMQIIPQDPILLTGTVRTNLFASEETVTDTDVWEALERVGLKEYVSCLAEKLDAPIDASGSIMSFGQRQLMCLARAFLAKPVILVMGDGRGYSFH